MSRASSLLCAVREQFPEFTGLQFTGTRGLEDHLNEIKEATKLVPQQAIDKIGNCEISAVNRLNSGSRGELTEYRGKPTLAIAKQSWTGKRYHNNKSVAGTVLHEMGHALDRTTNYRLSSHPDFRAALAKDIQKMTPEERKSSEYFFTGREDQDPARAGPRETFAEMFRLAYHKGQGAFAMSHQRANEVFGNSVNVLKGLVEN